MNFSLNGLVERYAPLACKGIFLSVGMCGEVILGVAINAPVMSPFGAFAAMIAMNITPRHGVAAKVMGAAAGCIFLLLAASLSEIVGGKPVLALILLFCLSWLAVLPKKDLSYIGFVTKCGAVAVLLSYFDFRPTLAMGIYFCSGILIGLLLSLAEMAFEKEDQTPPLDQLKKFLKGDFNNPWTSLLTPITVVLASIFSEFFSFSEPAWVGLTIIYVSNSKNNLELRRVFDRLLGTIAGTCLAYFILVHINSTLQLALIVGIFAFLIPFAEKYYSLFSMLITTIVLILIDIAMFGHGGDMHLLFWRCADTLFGCLWVLCGNLILMYIYWLKRKRLKKK